MKIKTKLRLLIAFYASLPVLAFWIGALNAGITRDEGFQYAFTSGMASLLFIVLALPLFGTGWIFFNQFEKISFICTEIKNGRYQYFSLTNQPKDESEENELSFLMRNMNWMIRKISARESDLEEKVNQRTAELVTINRELKTAKEKADASAEAKGQFLAIMSHEIRTPLHAIMGLNEQLKKSDLNSKQQDHVQTISEASKNLLRIINDILDFSKIDAGKIELEQVPFSIDGLISDVKSLHEGTAMDKGIQFHTFIADNVPERLTGDPLRIKQILINLVSNALKFTLEGMVTLSVKAFNEKTDNVTLTFDVKDTGIGISKEIQSKIFEAFTQADSSTSRHFGGTGLGMAICSQLAELMDGKLTVKSEQGKGSLFSFTITLSSCACSTELSDLHPGRTFFTSDTAEAVSHLEASISVNNSSNPQIKQSAIQSNPYCRGKQQAMVSIVERFSSEFKTIFDEIKTAVMAEKKDEATFLIQRIKDAAAAVSATRLYDATCCLEDSLEQKRDVSLFGDLALCKSEWIQVLNKSKKHTSETKKTKTKSRIQNTDLSEREFQDKIEALEIALNANNLRAKNLFLEISASLQNYLLKKEVSELEKNIRVFNFKAASKVLSQIRSQLSHSSNIKTTNGFK